MEETYYSVLEIAESASSAEIKDAYRKLAREYHPDRLPEEVRESRVGHDAADTLKLINEAHRVLSDSAKRQEYDRQLAEYRGVGYASPSVAHQPSPPKTSTGPSSTASRQPPSGAPPPPPSPPPHAHAPAQASSRPFQSARPSQANSSSDSPGAVLWWKLLKIGAFFGSAIGLAYGLTEAGAVGAVGGAVFGAGLGFALVFLNTMFLPLIYGRFGRTWAIAYLVAGPAMILINLLLVLVQFLAQ